MKTALRSGAGKNDIRVQRSEMFPFLGWLEPYFVDRESSTNFEPEQQEEENTVDHEDDMEDSVSVVLTVTPSDLSRVTGRAQYRKRARYTKVLFGKLNFYLILIVANEYTFLYKKELYKKQY